MLEKGRLETAAVTVLVTGADIVDGIEFTADRLAVLTEHGFGIAIAQNPCAHAVLAGSKFTPIAIEGVRIGGAIEYIAGELDPVIEPVGAFQIHQLHGVLGD